MERFGQFMGKRAVWVVILFGVATAVALLMGVRPGSEDDVLKFLPRTNPKVERFYHVNEKFGALHVALVGIKVNRVFTRDVLSRLGALTRRLENEVVGVHRVLGLTSLNDFALVKGREGGLKPQLLVDPEHLPLDGEGMERLKKTVLSKKHVVGNFVDKEATAVVLVVYLASKGEIHQIAANIKREVTRAFPKAPKFWGGTPFISSHIFAVTQQDLRKLTPWAVALIIVVMLLAFRDPIGVLLALAATVFGGIITFYLMRLLDIKVNLVLGSMPVILFAVGSAYGIHFLVRYYHLRQKRTPTEAVAGSMVQVGPGILAAGLTTVGGFVSFLVMDIEPMREFGLFTALGILSCLLAALMLIPAVLVLSKRSRTARQADTVLKGWMGSAAGWGARHRVPILGALGVVAAVGLYFAVKVKFAVETSSFFKKGSEPHRAEKFLRENFGGSLFVQIHLKADLDDPVVLREIQRISRKIEGYPEVSSVQHAALPYTLVNEAMVELRRVPDTREKVQTLSAYVLSDPSSLQLMTADRKEALVHIKLRTSRAKEVDRVIHRMNRMLRSEFRARMVAVNLGKDTPVKTRQAAHAILASDVADALVALAAEHGLAQARARRGTLVNALTGLGGRTYQPDEKDYQAVSLRVRRYLRSKECIVPLPPAGPAGDSAEQVAMALARLGPSSTSKQRDEAVVQALGGSFKKEQALDLAATAEPYLEDAWKSRRGEVVRLELATALGVKDGAAPAKLKKAMSVALMDLQTHRVGFHADRAKALGLVGQPKTIDWTLTGMPVLHQGLAQSVRWNQVRSLVVAGILVVVIIGGIFRSLWAAFVALFPAGMTLMLIFGFMGLWGLNLDVGTSMIASIALGVGIDYAIHFLVWWRRQVRTLGKKRVEEDPRAVAVEAATDAARQSGTAILANAFMVAAAFLVLTLGDAEPLRVFGGMTAAAMLLAAAMTFWAVPALAGPALAKRWAMSGAPDPLTDQAEAERQGDVVLREKTKGVTGADTV